MQFETTVPTIRDRVVQTAVKLGLTLNETKTCLRTASRESFDFLGYTFGQDRYRKTGQTYLAAKPSKKACNG